MTKLQAQKCVLLIMGYWERWNPTEEKIGLFERKLATLDYDITLQVIDELVERRPFAPALSELLAPVRERMAKREREHCAKRSREIAQQIVSSAPLLEDGRINHAKAEERLKAHPEFQALPLKESAWRLIDHAMKELDRKPMLPSSEQRAALNQIASTVTQLTALPRIEPLSESELKQRRALIHRQIAELAVS